MNKRSKKKDGNIKLKNPDNHSTSELTKEINQVVSPFIPREKRTEVITQLTDILIHEAYSGPVPHPSHLREYEEILPGSAERILLMAERAQNHNQEMERTIVNTSSQISWWAMWLGFISLTSLIGAAVFFGIYGNNALVYSFLGAGFLGGATTLIRGWNKKGSTTK